MLLLRNGEPRWALLRQRRGQWANLNYFDALGPYASEQAAQEALGMTPATIGKVRATFPDVPSDILPKFRR